MRATEHAPRNPFQFLECSNSLAHIVERGAGVVVEHPRVIPPQRGHELLILSMNASRHGHCFTQQGPGFAEAL